MRFLIILTVKLRNLHQLQTVSGVKLISTPAETVQVDLSIRRSLTTVDRHLTAPVTILQMVMELTSIPLSNSGSKSNITIIKKYAALLMTYSLEPEVGRQF
jgi:hypothetical protein